MFMTVDQIASVCHEANVQYCLVMGDDTQPPWHLAPEWQKTSAIAGVQAILSNPDLTPQEAHKLWMDRKASEGWQWGPRKDPEKKEHPCMLPYEQLPADQRVKDELFTGIAKTLLFPLEDPKR